MTFDSWSCKRKAVDPNLHPSWRLLTLESMSHDVISPSYLSGGLEPSVCLSLVPEGNHVHLGCDAKGHGRTWTGWIVTLNLVSGCRLWKFILNKNKGYIFLDETKIFACWVGNKTAAGGVNSAYSLLMIDNLTYAESSPDGPNLNHLLDVSLISVYFYFLNLRHGDNML